MQFVRAVSPYPVYDAPALAGRSTSVDPLVYLDAAVGRLRGSKSFLGGEWGEAGLDANGVSYALRRSGRLVGRLRYFGVDWREGTVERLADPGDGTAEILMTFSNRRVRHILEAGVDVLRPLQDFPVPAVPIRVRWREADWAKHALQALISGILPA